MGEHYEQDNRQRSATREGDVPAVRTVPLLAYGVGRRGGAAKRQTPRKRRRRKLLVTTVTLDRPIAAAA